MAAYKHPAAAAAEDKNTDTDTDRLTPAYPAGVDRPLLDHTEDTDRDTDRTRLAGRALSANS